MPPSNDTQSLALTEFVAWCSKHITGDEKGEAQVFLDHLFRGFGHAGFKEAGATCEMRIKKDSGGTSFADLVWKPVVLIEMKRRGEDLAKHYRQAFDYWTRLVPGRPRYTVLCNFDEFWVFDFETQMDSPVDRLNLVDLPERSGPLAFLFAKAQKPVFGNHHEAVTRAAADLLAHLFNRLTARGTDRSLAQRFVLQVLMALFAEDIGLLPQYFLTRLLDECNSPQESYDLLGGLFAAMNTPGGVQGGRFKGVAYFNGGLFQDPARVELEPEEVDLLRNAAKFDWAKVRPEVFGTLFEHSMDKEEQHAQGAHFTHPADIMKIIGPTIVEPWRWQIESAKTLKRLYQLLLRLESFRVLDPACGSGNFLYIAYRELKRLEARIYERIGEFPSRDAKQRSLGFVMTRNFYGMDINPFAIAIAKVTMMLAHKLAIDELHVTENALPLDNLDTNFIVGDALMADAGGRTEWPTADVIVGNPPFLGTKDMKPELGTNYVDSLRALYPEVPGMADHCVYWFSRAHALLPSCTPEDPVAGRAGLVGTQNIRNNASRRGGLDAICKDGTIVEAVETQPWSGEANVHVSIVNWVKSQDPRVLPRARTLWFKVAQRRAKDFDLDCRLTDKINSSLSDQADLSGAQPLACNRQGVVVSQGITPGHDGFLLDKTGRSALIAQNENSAEVTFPYLIGNDLLASGRPSRFIIDLGRMDILHAQHYSAVFKHLQANVLPDIQIHASEDKSERAASINSWWQHWRPRVDLITAIGKLRRYVVCSRVTKRPIFAFVSSDIRPGDALQVFAFDDDYSFGILQSFAHWQWFVSNCSKLTERLRYTSESVFDTFPWPQEPTERQIVTIAQASRTILRIRAEFSQRTPGGLRVLYRTLDVPGKNPLRDAHFALDKAVLDAYGFSQKDDLLQKLFDLNQDMARKISIGEAVTAPGIPPLCSDPGKLVTTDCLGL